MPAFDFNNERKVQVPQNKKTPQSLILDLKGLDLVTPVDLLLDGHTPFAKNFRLYAQQNDDRQVAVSSRKGPGHYIDPLGEIQSVSNTSTVAPNTVNVGGSTQIIMQPWVADNNQVLTSLDLLVANDGTGTGPLLVEIYENDAGKPGRFISSSSILNGEISSDAQYRKARFVKQPQLTSGQTYWIVTYIQDDGTGHYTLRTTTTGTKAWSTNSSIASAVEQSFAINFKTYTTPPGKFKGGYRFARDNGNNLTVVAHGTTLYQVDEATKLLSPITTTLNSSATEYSFTNADNKVFWVNGYDEVMTWNGTTETTNPQLVTNGTFETNTTGWTASGGGVSVAIARSTAQFHSGVASLSVTATSGNRVGLQNIVLKKNRRYHCVAWVKSVTSGSTINWYFAGPNQTPGTLTSDNNWQKFDFYYTPTADTTTMDIGSTGTNLFIDDVSIIDTGIEVIKDTELPILSQITMHKDRLWGVTASDPNKLVFSENPGNPSDQPVTSQWYYQWLSVSFIYVPRPHNGSPVTKIVSFQDGLVVFTQDRKYIISGYDRGSFNLREATGNKGALSSKAVTSDENRIYFASHDGLYEYNGSEDTLLSTRVSPLFDGCPNKGGISPVIWKNKVRFYMASSGSAVNDICLLYNKEIGEFEFDTNTYVDSAIYYGDADDEQELVEFSSIAPVAYLAEQGYNSLGAPIDFEYRFSYNSLGSPAQRKRIIKFFPLFQGVDSSFPISIAMDRDFQNSPRIKELGLIVNGNTWGNFNWGDGTLWGGATSFKMQKLRFSGYGYYWQLRVAREAVNNRVAFIGAQYSYRAKRI